MPTGGALPSLALPLAGLASHPVLLPISPSSWEGLPPRWAGAGRGLLGSTPVAWTGAALGAPRWSHPPAGCGQAPPPPPQPNASAGERQELAEASKQESPAQDTGQGPGCVTATTCVCGAAPRALGRPGSRASPPSLGGPRPALEPGAQPASCLTRTRSPYSRSEAALRVLLKGPRLKGLRCECLGELLIRKRRPHPHPEAVGTPGCVGGGASRLVGFL